MRRINNERLVRIVRMYLWFNWYAIRVRYEPVSYHLRWRSVCVLRWHVVLLGQRIVLGASAPLIPVMSPRDKARVLFYLTGNLAKSCVT